MTIAIDIDAAARPVSVRLAGELNIYHAAEAHRALLPLVCSGADTEADLSGLTEVDSAGMQVLLVAKREASRNGTPFRLANHSRAVLGVLDQLNLSATFGDPVVIPAAGAADGRRADA